MKALRVGNDCKQYHGARGMVHVAREKANKDNIVARQKYIIYIPIYSL